MTKSDILQVLNRYTWPVQATNKQVFIVIDENNFGDVADDIIALGNPTYGTKYKIRKGDKFLCLKDYIMDDGSVAYVEGKTYTSEKDDHIEDEDCTVEHNMADQNDFFEYFKPLQ
jgi:hypothetical protein